ncbi:MAG: FkbM family methyltransferase [Pseudomonadota bacterium]
MRKLFRKRKKAQIAEIPPPEAQRNNLDVELLEQIRSNPHTLTYSKVATKEDIYFCFRLILGRVPNPEEWPGHSSRVGEELDRVVETFINSVEFENRNLQEVKIPEGVTLRDNGKFKIYADEADPMIGIPSQNGTYEMYVTAKIEEVLKPGDTFIDIGANIGYFSLLASQIVGREGQVVAIEPNAFNVKLLEHSVVQNGFENVSVAQVAVSEKIETLFLHATVGNGATSKIEQGDAPSFNAKTIPALPLDAILSSHHRPVDLIKVDVEGFEYIALKGARTILDEDSPGIVLEFTPTGMIGTTGAEFLKWLLDQGYGFINLSNSRSHEQTTSIEEIMDEFEMADGEHIDLYATKE